mmetsp:Transcript_1898/g.6108  ORF Transcript_1898/g.6108 Transcript_1898/m.6108 type:complete len:92 (-) Transcript_1898:4861-5136(-)
MWWPSNSPEALSAKAGENARVVVVVVVVVARPERDIDRAEFDANACARPAVGAGEVATRMSFRVKECGAQSGWCLVRIGRDAAIEYVVFEP